MRKLQHPVPQNLLVHIGDITVSFALLESEIESLVGNLISHDQRTGQTITAELSFRNLRALLVSLYLHRYGKDSNYEQFRELIMRLENIEVKRNVITHSRWAAGGTADTISRIKTTAKEKHGFKFDFETMSENQFVDIATEIKVLASDVQVFALMLAGIKI